MNHFTRWSCLLATLLGLGLHAVLGAEKPLNILVLLADDCRYDTLGCAGNAVVQTPNLDRLADIIEKGTVSPQAAVACHGLP